MEKKTIGTFLAALRKANGMTQKQLAEKLNVSDKAVSRWERDECAPDLSLIPVLAEIYGVTSDEILRGQRRDPDAPVREAETIKADKQRRHLIKNTHLKFRIRSILSIAIALVGLLAAGICNLGFYEGEIGLMLGSIFYLAAAVCQIIFLILGRAAVSEDEQEGEDTADCKKSMVYFSEWIFTGIMSLFAFTLPLLGCSHVALDFEWWCMDGFNCSLISAMLCGLLCLFINWRLGYLSSSKNRLRLRCGAILLAILAALLFLQAGINSFLIENRHLLTEHTRFDHLQDFREFMETPMDPDGNPMELLNTSEDDDTLLHFRSTTGELYTLSEISSIEYLTCNEMIDGIAVNPVDSLAAPSFTPAGNYAYHRYNLSVEIVEIDDPETLIPIYVYTAEQAAAADTAIDIINSLYLLLYIAAIVMAVFYYIKKAKTL